MKCPYPHLNSSHYQRGTILIRVSQLFLQENYALQSKHMLFHKASAARVPTVITHTTKHMGSPQLYSTHLHPSAGLMATTFAVKPAGVIVVPRSRFTPIQGITEAVHKSNFHEYARLTENDVIPPSGLLWHCKFMAWVWKKEGQLKHAVFKKADSPYQDVRINDSVKYR